MKLLRFLLAGCAVFLTACASQYVAAPRDLSTLEDKFRWVAFHGDQGEPHALMRWEDPIRAVTLGASERDRQKVERHLALLADLTGLDVSVVHAAFDAEISVPADYNMVVMFGDADALFPYARAAIANMGLTLWRPNDFSCGVQPYVENGRVIAAVVLIRNDITTASLASELVTNEPVGLRRGTSHPYLNLIRGCVAQETTQALGLTGDMDHDVATIFSSQSVYIQPTESDRRLIRILYDQRLEPEMTEEQAAPIIRQIIADNGW